MEVLVAIIVGIVICIVCYLAIKSSNAVMKGKCPRCGSPIRPFYTENMTGWTCDKCEWWEAVDNYGNAIP